MAIVPDKAGVRPGRPGNIPLSDPRNQSTKERMVDDDCFRITTQIIMTGENQLILSPDATRNSIMLTRGDGEGVVYLSLSTLTGPNGIPLLCNNGFVLRGKAAQGALYCWGVANETLVIFIG